MARTEKAGTPPSLGCRLDWTSLEKGKHHPNRHKRKQIFQQLEPQCCAPELIMTLDYNQTWPLNGNGASCTLQ
jgi:hypothetical protein